MPSPLDSGAVGDDSLLTPSPSPLDDQPKTARAPKSVDFSKFFASNPPPQRSVPPPPPTSAFSPQQQQPKSQGSEAQPYWRGAPRATGPATAQPTSKADDNPARQWYTFASIFGVMGSKFTQKPLTDSTSSAAKALDSYKHGDRAAGDRAYDEWMTSMQSVQGAHDYQTQGYDEILAPYKTVVQNKNGTQTTTLNIPNADLPAIQARMNAAMHAFGDNAAMMAWRASPTGLAFADLEDKRARNMTELADKTAKVQKLVEEAQMKVAERDLVNRPGFFDQPVIEQLKQRAMVNPAYETQVREESDKIEERKRQDAVAAATQARADVKEADERARLAERQKVDDERYEKTQADLRIAQQKADIAERRLKDAEDAKAEQEEKDRKVQDLYSKPEFMKLPEAERERRLAAIDSKRFSSAADKAAERAPKIEEQQKAQAIINSPEYKQKIASGDFVGSVGLLAQADPKAAESAARLQASRDAGVARAKAALAKTQEKGEASREESSLRAMQIQERIDKALDIVDQLPAGALGQVALDMWEKVEGTVGVDRGRLADRYKTEINGIVATMADELSKSGRSNVQYREALAELTPLINIDESAETEKVALKTLANILNRLHGSPDKFSDVTTPKVPPWQDNTPTEEAKPQGVSMPGPAGAYPAASAQEWAAGKNPVSNDAGMELRYVPGKGWMAKPQ